MFHTFTISKDGTCTVGYWLTQRSNELPKWVPLFDVPNGQHAITALGVLNGSGWSYASFTVTRIYS